MSLTQEQLAQMRADAEAGKRAVIKGSLLALICEHVLTLVDEFVAQAASAVCVRNAETQRMDEAMAAQMSKWIKVDAEYAHAQADRLLEQFLESLGYTRLVNAYDQVDKWYS